MLGLQRPASRDEDETDVTDAEFNAILAGFAWVEPTDKPPERLKQEARAAELGVRLPRYMSDEQMTAQTDYIEAALAARRLPTVSPMLPPATAAEKFLQWLRASGRAGQHTSDQLRHLYGIHCREANLTPVPENQLRKYLGGGNSPGVSRLKVKGKLHGNRHRPTLWQISPTVAMRRAA